MREKENNWERIEAVIKWANMTTNYFARYIGLARGENLYQIKRGNNGISFDVANRIVAKFPQIDKLWLLTGEGQMFADSRERGARIPFYDVDVEQGLAQLARLKSHIAKFRSAGDSDESAGRKLDFIVQEMNREVNTLDSKVADAEIRWLAVDAKAALERIREQIQNLE